MPAALPASIPSPSESVWHLGPLPLRAYALCIIAGIVVAIWLGNKRWIARGGEPGVVGDISVWAVPFGIIGGRLYHVITDNQLYFGEGTDPWRAFAIWEGGLGIWGAIALGGVGAWIGCRRRGVPLPAMADALAPGIVLAQAIGRWGNWFNQELFGRPTDLPWALQVSDDIARDAGYPAGTTFHPTFLYESLWAVLVAVVLIWADKRFRMGHGRVFALYVAGYTLGRGFFEYLRIDPANEIFGLRVNLWVSGLVFLGAVAYIVVSLRKHPG
ncbi:MAG: prolipoprotein diacylglyceryl transferase, partial [Jiangellaceae bacterium]